MDESLELTKFENPSDKHEIIISEAIPITRPIIPSIDVTYTNPKVCLENNCLYAIEICLSTNLFRTHCWK